MNKALLLLLFSGIGLLACQSDQDSDLLPSDPDPVLLPLTTIIADTTDLEPIYSSRGYDHRLDGAFFFEENYFINNTNYQFTLQSGFFQADYQGNEAIRDNHVYSDLMCVGGNFRCPEEGEPATLWETVGELPEEDTLVWEYTNYEREKRYRYVMTDIPQRMSNVEVPDTLRMDEDQVITFTKASEQDSLNLELIIISKEKMKRNREIPFIDHSRTFFAKLVHEAGKVTVLSGELQYMNERGFSPTEEDTAFWNVAAVRKVIKTVDGKNMQLTYQVNHIIPVTVE